MPKFTVITATWNRSHHIIPTIKSVLAQTFTDFEYLIVGDCCSDDTEEVVRPFLSDRVHWLTTTERWKTQSGSNNVGIAAAKGDFIAYIGHDDLWGPDQLACHLKTLTAPNGPDFSASACLSFGSPGTNLDHLVGIDPQATRTPGFFYVPTSIAHRRDVTDRIGPWKRPGETDRFVDVEFECRAQDFGMSFAANGAMTAFKFTAGLRYLSYLDKDSFEQTAFLARMKLQSFPQELAQFTSACAEAGRSTATQPIFGDGLPLGEGARRIRELKGLIESDCVPLTAEYKLEHHIGWRAQDWHGHKPNKRGFIWSGPNPAPRMLIPVTCGAPVRLEMQLFHPNIEVFANLKFQLNGVDLPANILSIESKFRTNFASIQLSGELREAGPSVLRIFHPEWAMHSNENTARRGVAVGSTRISMVPRRKTNPLKLVVIQAWRELMREIFDLLPVAARHKKP